MNTLKSKSYRGSSLNLFHPLNEIGGIKGLNNTVVLAVLPMLDKMTSFDVEDTINDVIINESLTF